MLLDDVTQHVSGSSPPPLPAPARLRATPGPEVSPLRIGLLTASLSRQGGNVSAALCALARSLHQPPELHAAAFGVRDELIESDRAAWGAAKVTATLTRGPRKFGFSRELDLALAEAQLDLLHIHGLWIYTSVASRRWADATARPYIITPHGMLDPWALRRSRWKKLCAGLLFEIAHLRGAACLHARCEAEAQTFRDLKLRNPICILSNAVAPAEVRSARGGPELDAQRGQILLCFGPLRLDGGARTLLQAWQLVYERLGRAGCDWSLVLIVADEDRAALARECCARGIERSVHFVAPDSGCHELWQRAAAAVLLPSASEQMVNAAHAWSHGMPVLLCDASAINADLRAAGALIAEPNAESLAQGLLTLVDMSATQRAAMGRAARRLVESRVAPATVAEGMVRVYRWLLGRGPKPACVIEQ